MSAKQQAGHMTERYAKRASMLMVFVTAFLAGCGSTRKAQTDEAASAPTVRVIMATRKDLSSAIQIASEFEPYQEVEM